MINKLFLAGFFVLCGVAVVAVQLDLYWLKYFVIVFIITAASAFLAASIIKPKK